MKACRVYMWNNTPSEGSSDYYDLPSEKQAMRLVKDLNKILTTPIWVYAVLEEDKKKMKINEIDKETKLAEWLIQQAKDWRAGKLEPWQIDDLESITSLEDLEKEYGLNPKGCKT